MQITFYSWGDFTRWWDTVRFWARPRNIARILAIHLSLSFSLSLSQRWPVACWFPAAGLWVTGSTAGAPEVPSRKTSSCFTWKQKQKTKISLLLLAAACVLSLKADYILWGNFQTASRGMGFPFLFAGKPQTGESKDVTVWFLQLLSKTWQVFAKEIVKLKKEKKLV